MVIKIVDLPSYKMVIFHSYDQQFATENCDLVRGFSGSFQFVMLVRLPGRVATQKNTVKFWQIYYGWAKCLYDFMAETTSMLKRHAHVGISHRSWDDLQPEFQPSVGCHPNS